MHQLAKQTNLKRMKSMAAPKIQNVEKIKAMTRKRTSSCLNPTFSASHSLEKTNPKASSQAQSSNRANRDNISEETSHPVDQIRGRNQEKSAKRQKLTTKIAASDDSNTENSLALCVGGFLRSCKIEQDEPASKQGISLKLTKIKEIEAESKLSPAANDHIECNRQITNNYSSSNALSDCVMIVQETELHVNKSILGFHSDKFKSLFAENKTITQMKVGAKLDAMVQLLDLFYNRISITDSNVKRLMKMAKLVQAYQTLTNCEIFLLQSGTMSLAKRLFLAQEYGLQHLRKQCMDRCADADEAKKLKIEPEFKLLKADVLQEIFTKLV